MRSKIHCDGNLPKVRKIVAGFGPKIFCRSVKEWSGIKFNALGKIYRIKEFRNSNGIDYGYVNLWYGYDKGVRPIVVEVIKAVEEDFPGVSTWLNHPLWDSLQPQIGLDRLSELKRRLPIRCRELLLVDPTSPANSGFYAVSDRRELARIVRLESPASLSALIILMREALLLNQPQQYFSCAIYAALSLKRLGKHPAIRLIHTELSDHFRQNYLTTMPGIWQFPDPISISSSEDRRFAAWSRTKVSQTKIIPAKYFSDFCAASKTSPLRRAKSGLPSQIEGAIFGEAAEAVPTITEYLLGGRKRIGFALDTYADLDALICHGVSDKSIAFFAQQFEVTAAVLLASIKPLVSKRIDTSEKRSIPVLNRVGPLNADEVKAFLAILGRLSNQAYRDKSVLLALAAEWQHLQENGRFSWDENMRNSIQSI